MKIKRIDSGDPLNAVNPKESNRSAQSLFMAASMRWAEAGRILLSNVSAMDNGQLDVCSNIRTSFESAEDPGYRLFYEFHATPSQGWALLRFDHQENDVRWWTRDDEVVYRVKVRDPHPEALGETGLATHTITYYEESGWPTS